MSGIDTIKSYLISLGFDVDQSSYNKAHSLMDAFGEGVLKLAPKIVESIGKASVAFASLGAAAAAGTAKFLDGLGNQEIQMEMLSRQLWTTQQRAQAFSYSLKALGANLQDLYLSPTLMHQYRELNSVANEMTTPGDYNAQIKQIQDISLQMKEMRLEFYYGLQWVGYYFSRYLSGPLSKVQGFLTSLNKSIVKNMPVWTEKVADVMLSFEQAGVYTVQALKSIWDWLVKMDNYIPGWAKGIAAALALISISNPFTLFLEGLSSAILLLDDFETYVHGGKAAFPQLWAWVIKTGDALNKLGIPQQFQTNIEQLGKSLGTLGTSLSGLISSIGDLYDATQGKQGQGIVGFFQLIGDTANTALQMLNGAIDTLSLIVTGASDVLHGKWRAAGNIVNLLDGAGGTLPPSLGGPTPKKTTLPVAKPGDNGYPWVQRPRTTKRQQQSEHGAKQKVASRTHPARSESPYNPAYSYAYPQTTIHNNHSKSLTVNAPITQHINTQSGPNAGVIVKTFERGAALAGNQLIASFRGLL